MEKNKECLSETSGQDTATFDPSFQQGLRSFNWFSLFYIDLEQ
jgi:hypothetical protein